ncbi:hypothetical protein M885DRAFT_489327 [Pelagophyceae sp. CCMP2097]|nr:hypothetical protein M885DRAFT_489327 [Pelagophyceae sp. CCMP2097]|mmetsp:Transcript_30736/g.105652  ORF Transcript_30736/g.105652 Transcript_30736/m.105652 type:complete len:336 (-) Transcript_30736:89-1096(-)
MAGGDDSGLVSFFFYVLFVYPATNWILRPGRFSKQKGLLYACGMLALIAAVKTGMELQEAGPNYYMLLDVTRSSNSLEMKRAYKRMSLELHPDKNPSPTASDEFAALKAAYDVLSDSELKEVYNRFGPEGVKQNKRVDEYRMLLEIGVFYAAWAVMAYVLTLGKAASTARQWVFTGGVCMLVVETVLMLQEFALPAWFLPKWTEHEVVALLHNLFPAFMNGCRCIGGFLYVDLDEQQRQLLIALHEQNKDVVALLRDLQAAILRAPSQALGAAAVGGAAPALRLEELEATLRGGAPPPHPAALKIAESAGAGNNLGLYAMIAAYVGLYYCFSGTK